MTTHNWPTDRAAYLALAEKLITLFAGRRDVVARFHDFEKNGQRFKGWGPWKGKRVSADYQPGEGETVGEFKDHNRGGKELRLIRPFSPQNLVEHLRGKERLGVYVLDQDAQCSFLAADFDDHDGRLEPAMVWAQVSRFADAARAHDWLVHIERSKSGSGYHVFLFFDAPVPASSARAIGKWLFEESQTLREGEDFSTFDRFFPAQSQLPPSGRGFGNLIGLPLFGAKEYAEGRTAWVDDDGNVIPDPAAYVDDIIQRGRNPAVRVAAFMSEWNLSPDERDIGDHVARDPSRPLESKAEFEVVCQRCKFLQFCARPENQADIKEPLWYAMITNASRFEADGWIQDASKHHPSYSALATKTKIDHAREMGTPMTCAYIQELGFEGCPKGGCKLPNGKATKSPAGLKVWAESGDKPRKRHHDRTVRVKAGRDNPATTPATPLDGEPWAEEIEKHEDTGLPWPPPPHKWTIDTDGVRDPSDNIVLLRPLWVDALTRNSVGMWGVSIKFFDLDWQLRSYALPRDRLHEQGGVLGRELAAFGLPIVPGKEKWVSRFIVIQEGLVLKRLRAAQRLGWFDSSTSSPVFVLPDQVLGSPEEEIVYQPDSIVHAAETIHGNGKLRDWQVQIADKARGNPVLMFSLMLGMAGPLLKLCQVESGGFHLYGVTTGGKTTAAQVAASVWGCAADPQEGPEVTSIRKWHTTASALEVTAEVHNDTLLTLDEIGEVDPHELGRIIYQLAGGLSKGRANAGGGLRAMRTWRMLFFSTGEKSARQVLGQAGQDQKGGQRVRLPDIPADDSASGDRSIVIDAHGQDPKTFVQDLKADCARHYGLAGPVFVAYLIQLAERDGFASLSGQLRQELQDMEEVLMRDLDSTEATGKLQLPPEGRRVIRRLALVALAGCHASQCNILDWEVVEIVRVVTNIRDRWLSEQGQERSELERGLSHLRDAMIANLSRFVWHEDTPHNIRDIIGFRVHDYFLLTDSGIRELCGDYDVRTILRALKTDGLLWTDKDRLTHKSPRLRAFDGSRPYLYWIKNEFLGKDEADPDVDNRYRTISEPPPYQSNF